MDRSTWDKRADGSTKGDGFFGILPRLDGSGKVSSEISIGVDGPNGKEVEIPTMVPTLSPHELEWLLKSDVSDPQKIPPSIVQKAVDFARQRQAQGLPYFARPGEQQYHIYPGVPRLNVPTGGFNDATIRPVASHPTSGNLAALASLGRPK